MNDREQFEAWAEASAIRTDLGAWEAWQAARQAPDYSPLFTRIDEAVENYVRFGAVCEFEGQPMIYAATLLEIGNLLGEVAPNKDTAQPLQQPAAENLSAAFGAKAAEETVREFGQRMYEKGKADALQQEGGKKSCNAVWYNDIDNQGYPARYCKICGAMNNQPCRNSPQPSDKVQQASTSEVSPRYQTREIGESDWKDATKEEYEYCQQRPEMDTRILPQQASTALTKGQK